MVRKPSLVFMSPFLVSLFHEVYKRTASGLCPGKPVSEELMERISLVRQGLERALGSLEEFSACDIWPSSGQQEGVGYVDRVEWAEVEQA